MGNQKPSFQQDPTADYDPQIRLRRLEAIAPPTSRAEKTHIEPGSGTAAKLNRMLFPPGVSRSPFAFLVQISIQDAIRVTDDSRLYWVGQATNFAFALFFLDSKQIVRYRAFSIDPHALKIIDYFPARSCAQGLP